jgi:hypothetical protein
MLDWFPPEFIPAKAGKGFAIVACNARRRDDDVEITALNCQRLPTANILNKHA